MAQAEENKFTDCLYFPDKLIALEDKKMELLKAWRKGLVQLSQKNKIASDLLSVVEKKGEI